MKTKEIANHINMLLQQGFKSYFTAKNIEGQVFKIRVADHRMNERNNSGDRTLSFVSGWNSSNNCHKSDYEWLIENGECEAEQRSLEEIIGEFELIEYRA